MPRTVWIFDLEKMVDNAGIGKEIILLQQLALFVILDYFQLSNYRLWVCWRLTTWLAAPSSTLKPGALKAEKRKPSESAGPRAAPHSQLKACATLGPLILQKTARKPCLLGPCKGLPKLGLTIFSRTKAVLTSCVFACPN